MRVHGRDPCLAPSCVRSCLGMSAGVVAIMMVASARLTVAQDQPSGSPIASALAPKTERLAESEVTIPRGEEAIKAFVAMPQTPSTRWPAVVVIQEWWGLTDWIRDQARQLAKAGYVVIAPDLYRGQVTDDPKVARQLRMGLPEDRAIADLRAAVAYLAQHPAVDKTRIGCVGYCMGGQYSLLLAVNEPEIKACVICYGALITNAEALKPLNATVLGIFGEADAGIPPKAVEAFGQALKAAGKSVEELKIYPGTGHAFMRPTVGAATANTAYNAANANDAQTRIEAFFAKVLKGAESAPAKP